MLILSAEISVTMEVFRIHFKSILSSAKLMHLRLANELRTPSLSCSVLVPWIYIFVIREL